LAIPSAFTRPTGEAHWSVLIRARAIENGCFVLAAAQAGKHESGRETYGHSLIVSPWGEIMAEGGVHTSVIVADLNCAEVTQARQRIPSLQHDRPFQVVAPPMAETKLSS
jgi:predicted amidohydrolase